MKVHLKLAAYFTALLAVIGLSLVPAALISGNGISAALPGAVCGMGASIFGGRHWALRACLALAVAQVLATLASPSAILGALLMAVLAGTVGWLSRWGLNKVFQFVPTLSVSTLISPAHVADRTLAVLPEHPGLATGLGLGLGALYGGLCASVIMGVALRGRPTPTPVGVPTANAAGLAVALSMVTGVMTWVILSHYRVPVASWMLMTLIVLSQPTLGAGRAMSLQRCLGTFVGTLTAGAVALALPYQAAHVVVGLMLMISALVVLASGGTYWIGVSLLTPAVVLLGANPDNALTLSGLRLEFTLIGAAVVLTVSYLIEAVLRWQRVRGINLPWPGQPGSQPTVGSPGTTTA